MRCRPVSLGRLFFCIKPKFIIEAETEGASARELNRTFLSALRKVEKRTTLRAEWTSNDGTSERFFDYALKKTLKSLTRQYPKPGCCVESMPPVSLARMARLTFPDQQQDFRRSGAQSSKRM